MKAYFRFYPGRPAMILQAAFFILLNTLPCNGEENSSPARKPLFTWDILWTGSLHNSIKTEDDSPPPAEDILSGGTLFNRGELGVAMPRADLSFRFLATDKRLLPFEEENTKAGFNPGLGMYHNQSGSRFLQGIQNEYGLPARISNIWLRSVPFMESRSPQARDLKTDPAVHDEDETYLYLALPPDIVPGLEAFASTAIDRELNPALGGGIGLGGEDAEFRLEGFYTRKELPPRKAQTWFSSAPPLPERDFRIHALALVFNSPNAAFASDWAWSETFASGRGVYGNFALRLGNKPWRFSLAGDGAESRFYDRNGAAAGAGFRIAAKGEHFWPRSGLFRFQGIFRSPAAGEDFERGSLSLYFRPPAPRAGTLAAVPFRFSRASLGFGRDARKPEKTADTLDVLMGFRLGFFNAAFSGALQGRSRLDTEGSASPLYQPSVFETFESFKVSGELGCKAGIFDLKTRLGYTTRAKKDPLWEVSLNTSIKPGKWGRLGLKIASPDFPEKWDYTLSWRLESRFF